MPTIDDAFPYALMDHGRTFMNFATFKKALDMAKAFTGCWGDSISIIKYEKGSKNDFKVIGTVKNIDGRKYWVAKKTDIFNGRKMVPIKKGKKKKSVPAPFGL